MIRNARATVLLTAITLSAITGTADAQLGGLKKLRNALSHPDTSVSKDTAAHAAGSATDSARPRGSFLSRAAAVASQASDKFEKTTGVSAKDAALAASGVGVAGLVAKRAGIPDAGSVVGNALKNAPGSNSGGGVGNVVSGLMSKAMGGGAGSAMTGAIGGGAGLTGRSMTSGIPGNMFGGATLSSAGVVPQANVAAMLAFQQAMMQTAIAASAGDATAQAQLDAWQKLTLKYGAGAERLVAAFERGDMSAGRKLQELQVSMMDEWVAIAKLNVKAVKP